MESLIKLIRQYNDLSDEKERIMTHLNGYGNGGCNSGNIVGPEEESDCRGGGSGWGYWGSYLKGEGGNGCGTGYGRQNGDGGTNFRSFKNNYRYLDDARGLVR